MKGIYAIGHRPYLQRVMMWGCLTTGGLGPLVHIEGTMNANKYIATLQDHLLPYIQEMFPDGDCAYQHDNAPSHTPRTVT